MPKYSPDIIQKVQDENDIVDIISKFVPLKQKGNSYIACCPFHNEKTPSFHVDREKKVYHCFGCKAGGNMISFVMEKENLSFPETIEYLADQAGIELPKQTSYNSKIEEEKTKKRNDLLKIHQQSANFYYKNLIQNPIALNYLRNRNIHANTIKKFGLGYASDSWNQIYSLLKRSGFSDKDMLDSGLVLSGKKNNKPYDRFRGRIIIPIQNVMGKVIAFGARQLTNDKNTPKYLNSPETSLFNKGEQLFNLNRAKSYIRNKPLIIVEGYMDVIALDSYGFSNTAAALGTAFTNKHAKLISRYTKEIILCFDGDGAGEKATFKAIDVLKNSDLNIRIVRLPVEHDPDSFIREFGTERFQEELDKSVPIIDFKLNILERDNNLETSQGILNYVNQSCLLLKDLSDVERDLYAHRIAKTSGIDIDAIKKQITSTKPKATVNVIQRPTEINIPETQPVSNVQIKPKKRIPKELVEAQKIFLRFCYSDPEYLTSKNIQRYKLTNGFFRWFYERLASINKKEPNIGLIFEKEEDQKYESLVDQLIHDQTISQNLRDINLLEQAIEVIEKHYVETKIKQLNQALLSADSNTKEIILNELYELKKVRWN